MSQVFAFAGIAAALVLLAVFVGAKSNERKRLHRVALREMVRHNLDNAMDGGQFSVGGYLRVYLYGATTVHDIANDLTIYAEDCSGYKESELEPYVREWLMDRRLST